MSSKGIYEKENPEIQSRQKSGEKRHQTKIKFCGLSRPKDIEAVNDLQPDYVGFVFAIKSKRYVTPEQAVALKKLLHPKIRAAGVFVDEAPEAVAELLQAGVIDLAQLHGTEDEVYITKLRKLTDKPLIQAFRIRSQTDLRAAEQSSADYILLDSGAGCGKTFDWNLLEQVRRPYFLAGGLELSNVGDAIRKLQPYAVDVSSGIETDGKKDEKKMRDFSRAVREADNFIQ